VPTSPRPLGVFSGTEFWSGFFRKDKRERTEFRTGFFRSGFFVLQAGGKKKPPFLKGGKRGVKKKGKLPLKKSALTGKEKKEKKVFMINE